MERLGQVVVGAGVEARHLFAPGPPRGQDQDRGGHVLLAPAFQHRDAVDLRQAQVQDDGVIGFGVAQEVGFLAVGGVVDGVAGVAEGQLQLA